MSNQPAEGKSSTIRKRMVYKIFKGLFFLGLLLYWALFTYCDPFGIKRGTEAGSMQVFRALGLADYGVGSSETHRHVAVVTINDQTFLNGGRVFQGQRWPLSYAMQQKVLLKILSAKPAALFVDVRFTKENSNQTDDLSLDQAFSPVIKLANERHIPIFFARGDSDNEDMIKLGNRQYDLPAPLKDHEVYSNGTSGTNHYPLLGEVEQENNATERKSEKKEEFLNPALALYEALCLDRWKGSSLCAGFKKDSDFRKPGLNPPLIIKWGLIPDPDQHFVSRLNENTQELAEELQTSSLMRGVVSGEHALVEVSPKFADVIEWLAKKEIIPNDLEHKGFYPLTIGVQSLFDWEPYDPVRKTVDIDHNYISDYLQDRVVFYGTDLRDQHDDEELDGIGHMPGVVVHAMAFDNLMTYGRSYYHVNGITFLSQPILKVINFIIWCVLAFYIVFVEDRSSKENEDASEKNEEASSTKPRSWVGGFFRRIKVLFQTWGRRVANWEQAGNRLNGWRRFFVSFLLFCVVSGIGMSLGDQLEGAFFLGFLVSFYVFFFLGRKAGVWQNIMFIAALEGIFFQVNVKWLQWANTDWLALAVLWTMAQSGKIADNIHKVVGNMLTWLENRFKYLNKQRRRFMRK